MHSGRCMGEERDKNPIVHSAPRRLKCSTGQNQDEDYDSVALVSVVWQFECHKSWSVVLAKTTVGNDFPTILIFPSAALEMS